MLFSEKIFCEIEKLNRKIDRLASIVAQLPVTHNTTLGDWLSEEQAQELLNLGTTSLWSLRKQKKLVTSKIGNRTYYSRESILELIEKNSKKK